MADTINKIQAQILVEKAQRDPAWFCKKMLGADLWAMQKAIGESVFTNRYTTVVACHGPGKTFLAGNLALNFLYAYGPECKVVTTAPTARQVYSLLWSEIRTAHGRGDKIRPLGGEPLKTRLELAPNWFAEGFSTSEFNVERVQGYHAPHILIIVDEASGVADPIFDSLEGLMSSGDAHLLLIGNPNRSSGRFFESHSSTDTLYKKFKISVYDTPNFTYFDLKKQDMLDGSWKEKIAGKALPRPYLVAPQWVAERLEVWGEDSLLTKTKIDAEFPSGDESDKIIPMEFLAKGEQVFLEDERGSSIVLGVDCARFGSDESVIAARAGRQSLSEKVIRQKSTMAVTGAIQDVVHTLGAHRVSEVRLDVIGLGAGPVDRLIELQDSGGFPSSIKIIGVNVAQVARDKKKFSSQRDWLFWQFREGLQQEKISTTKMSADALQELCEAEYFFTSRGQIRVESKDELRKSGRLGHSPDRGDAWLLAFAEDVIPEKGARRTGVRVVSTGRR